MDYFKGECWAIIHGVVNSVKKAFALLCLLGYAHISIAGLQDAGDKATVLLESTLQVQSQTPLDSNHSHHHELHNHDNEGRQSTWWIYGLTLLIGCVSVLAITRIWLNQLLKEKHQNQQHKRKLVQLDRAKTAFFSNASHELKTPLNGIVGSAEAAIDALENNNPYEALALLGVIQSCGLRLNYLVNDLLDMAKLSEGGLILNQESVDIGEVTEQVLEQLKSKADEHHLAIINAIPKQFSVVFGDKHRIQKILFCLIDNAIKYSEAGSKPIRIEAIEEGGGC